MKFLFSSVPIIWKIIVQTWGIWRVVMDISWGLAPLKRLRTTVLNQCTG